MGSEHNYRIDYIEFPTTNIEKVKDFYSNLFGWAFTDWGTDYTSFDDGRLTGGFYLTDSPRVRGPLVIIYTEDLAALVLRIEEAGGRIVKPIFSFPGGQRFHFQDPVGNLLAVWSDAEQA